MFQVARWKVALVLVTTLLAIAFAVPNLIPASTLASLPGWVPKKTLNLGLDLRGGSRLQLEADTSAIQAEHMVNLVEDIRGTLSRARIANAGPVRSGTTITVDVNNPADLDRAYTEVSALIRPSIGAGAVQEFNLTRQGDRTLVASFRPEALAALTADAVNQAMIVIGKRIDPDGTRETSITRQGEDRIIVQAPGDNDPERLKNLIGQTARLTFQMVDAENLAQAASGILPPGTQLLMYEDGVTPILVQRRAVITGEMLTRASLTNDEFNQPAVQLRFNSQGARRFGDATAQNIGKQFAIILDGKVISAPVIQASIPNGVAIINGMGSAANAKSLSDLLNAGALPVPLTVIEQRSVTAELGADAVKSGETATLIAFAGVLVFMVLAYGFLFGGISIIGLVINGIMIIAAMSLTQATLSLPGIAGLILTLAMAVDANVLIFERMRDEARSGKNVIASMEAGFGRAMVTIIDANLTTLIAAWIMFIFGAGPVRGFAWTLSIGVITSVFTSVMITQVALAFWFRMRRPKLLPIL